MEDANFDDVGDAGKSRRSDSGKAWWEDQFDKFAESDPPPARRLIAEEARLARQDPFYIWLNEFNWLFDKYVEPRVPLLLAIWIAGMLCLAWKVGAFD